MIDFENLRDVNEPFFGDFTHNFNNVLNTGTFVQGSYVKRFEQNFAKFIGSNFCIGVKSGADALLLSIKSFDFEKKCRILIPANSHFSILLAVFYAGYVPILVEPEKGTYNIDPHKIEEKITANTSAIIAVHSFGKACNMDDISRIANNNNLKIIEECSGSHGAKYKNKATGSFGSLASFGFDPSKILGALGEAGAVTTSEKDIADRLKSLRNSGDTGSSQDLQGFNFYPNELQNGFLLSKLKKIDRIIEHKRKLADLYNMFLKDDFIKPVEDNDYFDVFQAYNIRHPKRDKLMEYLLENEIQTRKPLLLPAYKHKLLQDSVSDNDFPVAREIYETALSLPVSSAHQEMEIFKIIETMNKF